MKKKLVTIDNFIYLSTCETRYISITKHLDIVVVMKENK